MVKVNGWKRIGIIGSVVWILSAGVHTYDSEIRSASKMIASTHVACDERLAGKTGEAWTAGFNECNAQATDSLTEANKNAWIGAVLIAFAPVPLGWGFAYLLLFTAGWVKRGFSNECL